MFKMFNKIFKKDTKPSALKRLIKDPDGHVFTMEVNDDEIVIRIKKKEVEQV